MEIGDTWLNPTAIEAIQEGNDDKVWVYLKGGHHIVVRMSGSTEPMKDFMAVISSWTKRVS